MTTHRCRVLLVDDHESMREVVGALLTSLDDVQLVGEARLHEKDATTGNDPRVTWTWSSKFRGLILEHTRRLCFRDLTIRKATTLSACVQIVRLVRTSCLQWWRSYQKMSKMKQ